MSERKHKIWFRVFDSSWCVYVGTGRRRHVCRLAKGRENHGKAAKKYRKMLADGSAGDLGTRSKVKAICITFLKKHSKKNCSADTHKWYRHFLKSFCQKYGTVRVGDLRPFDVHCWLDSHSNWRETTRHRAVTCLVVALNWAAKMKVIKDNPIKGIDKGTLLPRERIMKPEERKQIISAVKDPAFKLVLFALGSTGARPSEIRRVTSQEFSADGLWVFAPRNHKTGTKTRKPRVVYLTDPMKKLSEKLAREHPTGPLFLNIRGKPWTANALRLRFKRLREKFPALAGITAYCFRHTYATDGLIRGVPMAQMQELLGHSSLAMIVSHYGHLGQKTTEMRAAATQAIHPRPRPA